MGKESFIAVHAGAGYHSSPKEKTYKEVCKDACLQAMVILQQKGSAVSAVCKAVCILENSPLTNAGKGANLTLEGTVECDAGVMDGRTLTFGGVGCISSVKNPVVVAERLVSTQLQDSLSLGRLPPSMLVGPGAQKWAEEQGIQLVDDSEILTDTTRSTYRRYKRKISQHDGRNGKILKTQLNQEEHESTPNKDELLKEAECNVQDTVGAVCVDADGNMAAASSSGGIWMKQPGRIGPATLYGAGSWAHNGKLHQTPGVAVVTSGSGEHLMKTLFAKTCADCVQKEENATLGVTTAFKENFLESEHLSKVNEKNGGALILKHEEDDNYREVEVLWAHTTQSMCIGYMSSHSRHPQMLISRLEHGSLPGKSLAMEGRCFKLDSV